MNASILGRIFWKEYRTQRDLWLAIVGLFSLFTILIPILLGEHLRPEVYSLYYAGVMASLFYAAASTSILYASEVEQGSKPWLGVLPLKPAHLLAAKAGWVVVSTLAAIAWFGIVAQLFGRTESYSADFENGELAVAIARYLIMLTLVFSCTMLASQLCNHVLKALGLAFVILIGMCLICAVLIDRAGWEGGRAYVIFAISAAMVFGVGIFLNQRWLRENSFVWRWTISLGRPLTLDRALALPLETSPLERTWRRQLWLEWRNARGWMLGIALVSVLLTAWLMPHAAPQGPNFESSMMMIACLVPLLCGVASCRGEQLHQRYLFLGNRGVSSEQVLWTKHLIWISFGAFLVCGLCLWGLTEMIRTAPAMGDGRIKPDFFSQVPRGALLSGLQLIATVALLIYSIGHICSLLFSQPILALFIAVFASIIGVMPMIWGYDFGVPLYATAIFPAVSLLLLSLYRGQDWMIARSDRKVWVRYLAWSLLGVWTWISLIAGWRVAEVRLSNLAEANELQQMRYLYPAICLGLFMICFAGVALADVFRRNYQPRAGMPPYFKRRWLTPLCVLCVFLVGHNSLIALGLTGNSIQSRSDSNEMSAAARAMTITSLNRTGPDLYLVARARIKTELPSNSTATRISIPEAVPARAYKSQSKTRIDHVWNTWEAVNQEQRDWLTEYEEAVEEFDAADRAGIFDRFVILDDSPENPLVYQGESFLDTDARLIQLIRLKALEREHAGELVEAWNYHLKLIRFLKRALVYALPLERENIQNWMRIVLFEGDLRRWQGQKQQSPELLVRAARELNYELGNWPSLSQAYGIAGGIAWELIRNTPVNLGRSTLGLKIPGWERDRALLLIEEITRINIALAQAIAQEGSFSTKNRNIDLDRFQLKADISAPSFRQLILERNGGESGVPLLLVTSSDQRMARHKRQNAYEGPWNLSKTTFILNDYPLGLDFFNAISDRPEPVLIDELDFRIAVRKWLAKCEQESPLSAPQPTQEAP